MPELLLELFSEEIPARVQQTAAADLKKAVNQRLLDAGFLPEAVEAFATPRRLTVVATGLPVMQPDRREERKGPRVGAPEKAVEGFLRGAGLASLDACEQREDAKGAYWVAVREQQGRPTADLVADFVPEIVGAFPWRKSMRWGDGALKWVRPLKSILCVFDGEVVAFEIEGVASGDTTHGHRFLAPDPIRARSFEAYAAALKSAHVVLDGAERAGAIRQDAQTVCAAQGLALVEDDALLAEVAGLVEHPVTMIGAFDEKFLTLPDEVLTASMRGHQKYFSVFDPSTERLANRFVVVANLEAPDGGAAMRQGYERVLTARLSDAWYLYHQDLKTPLGERLADLDRITYFEGLGTVGDKARRIADLAAALAPALGADPSQAAEAARLAKADLVTGMVYEFPELQGLMGGYYARAQNPAADAVADAIRDHYKPQGPGEAPPRAPVSAAVALADKLDTLAAFWSIGKKPTGSSDPFALRRAALGVVDILLTNGFRTPLRDVLATAARAFDDGVDIDNLVDDLIGFFHDRLKAFFKDAGRRHDRVGAVLRTADGARESDVVLIDAKLKALDAFLDGDDGRDLLAGYKRAANILKAAEKSGDVVDPGAADPTAFVEPAENALFAALQDAETAATDALSREDFDAAMTALAALRGPIDGFFETVTVNADDQALRAARLGLLARFRAATARVADFSALEG
ncbi:MAG: glycine--tRNA ligase subunit beta [Pseudomonadota bacterium]